MNKTLKALGIVFIGLILWIALVYGAIAFVKAETNSVLWGETARGIMIFALFCYVVFSPLLVIGLKEEMKP